MSFHIYKDPDSLAKGISQWIAGNINLVLKSQERYSFCLSGGNTPKKLYQILATVYDKTVDWSRVDFFWGDERYVPFDDTRNNARMAYETLLNPLSVPPKNIFEIETEDFAASEAMKYSDLLKYRFEGKPFTFDFALLGMGPDAHTLSLFPGSDLINEPKDWVREAIKPDDRMKRITLLPKVVNKSKVIAFLVQGDDKADALHNVIKGEHNPLNYPAQIIHPSNGDILWFVDEAAAQNI
ncbi:MAG: 6-phosphogluconolactonase [Chitinophagaceae bacterium]|nr:6-phosphogluconolactonase [Chitinophagaceae bacterium]